MQFPHEGNSTDLEMLQNGNHQLVFVTFYDTPYWFSSVLFHPTHTFVNFSYGCPSWSRRSQEV